MTKNKKQSIPRTTIQALQDHRTYTAQELADHFGRSLSTISEWQSDGLQPICDTGVRPLLFRGRTIKAWFSDRKKRRKNRDLHVQVWCERCQAHVFLSSEPSIRWEETDLQLGTGNSDNRRVFLHGACNQCGAAIHTATSWEKLQAFRAFYPNHSPVPAENISDSAILVERNEGHTSPYAELTCPPDQRLIYHQNALWIRDFIEEASHPEDGTLDHKTVQKWYTSFANYEKFIGPILLSEVSLKTAAKFVDSLVQSEKSDGETRAKSTINNLLYILPKFYRWLELKLKDDHLKQVAKTLSLSRKENITRITKFGEGKPTPMYSEFSSALNGLDQDSLTGRHAAAILVFSCCYGLRVNALRTIAIGALDLKTLVLTQDPDQNVNTKFGVYIKTPCFDFTPNLTEFIPHWVDYLKAHGLGDKDPLIPAFKYGPDPERLRTIPIGISNAFMASDDSIRKIVGDAFVNVGLPRYTPHAIRRMAARIAENVLYTAPQKRAFQIVLGHKPASTLDANYFDNSRAWAISRLQMVPWNRAVERPFPTNAEIDQMLASNRIDLLVPWIRMISDSIYSEIDPYAIVNTSDDLFED